LDNKVQLPTPDIDNLISGADG